MMMAAGTGVEERVLLRLSGGPPWGFRLSGGREVQSPLVVSKMRKRSAAWRAGMCERDEVVAINGDPCVGLTHTQAMNLVDAGGGSLDILVGRCRNFGGALGGEGGHRLRSSSYQELASASDSDAYFGETDSDANTDPGWTSSHRAWGGRRRSPRASPTERQPLASQQPPSFLSSSGAAPRDMGLYHAGGVEVSDLSEYDSTSELGHYQQQQQQLKQQQQQQQQQQQAVVNGMSGASGQIANGSAAPKQSSLHIVLNGGQEGDTGVTEGSRRSDAADGTAGAATLAAAPDGQAALAFTLNLAVRGGHGGAATREVDPLRNVAIVDEEELIATYKEKAKQARLNRGESLVEKQQKEVRRRCQNIAHSLASPVPRAPSADPTSPRPDSRGILMFRRRRQRVKRYTLVSYGMASDGEGGEPPSASGEDYDEDEEEDDEDEEDEEWMRAVGAEGQPNAWDAVSSDRDSAGVEGQGRGGRDSLPELGTGKGALLFERRRQRVEELSREDRTQERAAERRQENPGGGGAGGTAQNPGNSLGHVAGDQADALQAAPPPAVPSNGRVQPRQSCTFSSSVQLPPATSRGHGVSVNVAAPVTIAFNYSGQGQHAAASAAQSAQQPHLAEQQQQQQYQQEQQQYHYQQQQQQQQQSGVQNRSARPFTPVVEGPGIQRPGSAPFNRVSFSPKPPQQRQQRQQQQQQQLSLSSPGIVAVNRTAQAFTASAHGAQGPAAVAMPAVAEEPAPRACAQSPAMQRGSAAAVGEVLPSREQRISVPAVRTGVLQQAQRRPKQRLFSIPEPPKEKQRPNPELLSLVQGLDGRPAPHAGFESGPEDDFLSLGAEASNFLRSGPGVVAAAAAAAVPSAGGGGGGTKEKTPPPIAPKPSGGSKPSSPAEGPQENAMFLQHTPSPSPLHTASEPSIPTLQGKGGELFARRRTRMENYVVDAPRRAPTPSSPSSLPPSWLPTSTVRTPPPPSWGKQQQAKSGGGSAVGKGKRATKPLSAKEDFAWKPQAEDTFSAYSDPHPWSPLSPRPPGQRPPLSTSSASTLPTTGLSPWEAAARSPLGSVDAAFQATSAPAMVARAVLAAARRKTLPCPPEEWRNRVTGPASATFPTSSSSSPASWSGTLPRSFGSSRAPRIFQFGPEQRAVAAGGIGGAAAGGGGGGHLGIGGAVRPRSLSSATGGERGGPTTRVGLHRGSLGPLSPVDGSRDHNTRPRGWQGLSR